MERGREVDRRKGREERRRGGRGWKDK